MQFANRVKNAKPSPTLALNARAKKMQADGVNVINLTCGEPDFDTPQHIKDAAIKALAEGFTKYTPVSGIAELKDAVIAALKRERGLSYSREEIIITPGAKYAIFAAMQAVLNSDDEVIIPAPYWVSYPEQVLLCEAKPVIIKTEEKKRFKVSPEVLEKAITSKTRLVILNSPSNPTGEAYSAEELKALAGICVKYELWVLSDEIYDGIVFDDFNCRSIASFNGMKERTIVVNGVSKKYAMTGWRMGFASAPKALISQMDTIQGQAATCVTSITQKASVAAYNGPQEEAGRMTLEYQKRRDYMVEHLNHLDGITCNKPAGTFYVFPNVAKLLNRTFGGRKITSSAELAEYLLEKAHVATVPGEAFGINGYIRLSFATSLENIKEGIERIKKSLKGD
ncbi:MAG: pyridoxal phosphate-dependent aminotransferase [Deltaproteobacteria bacterium]|nr:pyridoxal phosphate-dependent aminotransferase [Deltaproteobacteria bacterium]